VSAGAGHTAVLRAVRHGPVGHEGICYGRLDLPPLEEPGRAAQRLLEGLAGPPPRLVFTSPLQRCRLLAETLAAQLGAAVQVDPRLRELDFGSFEGRSWETLEREEPGALHGWMEAWKTAAPPGGESLPQLESRVRSWLAEQPVEQLAASLLVGHAGVLRALRVLAGLASWDQAMEAPVPHLAWLELPVRR
jgi:alpha-ribazole phosphatase